MASSTAAGGDVDVGLNRMWGTRFEEAAGPSAACEAATEGLVYLDLSEGELRFCVGGAWRVLAAGAVCGDGSLAPGEACDDGNLEPGDGCDGACAVEEGWECTEESPAVCTGICGDGLRVADEECEDGDVEAGDGCDESCHTEWPAECWDYRELADGARSTASPAGAGCDDAEHDGFSPGAWHRFVGDAGATMPTTAPEEACGTAGAGWVFGEHPAEAGATSDSEVCFARDGEPCESRVDVRITNCGGLYFVYELPAAPGCAYAYCGAPAACGDGERAGDEECDDGDLDPGDGCDEECVVEPDQCVTYNVLDEDWRRSSNGDHDPARLRCDNHAHASFVPDEWHRYALPAGERMAGEPPGPQHCGGLASGWLDADAYPAERYETVEAVACFDGESDGHAQSGIRALPPLHLGGRGACGRAGDPVRLGGQAALRLLRGAARAAAGPAGLRPRADLPGQAAAG